MSSTPARGTLESCLALQGALYPVTTMHQIGTFRRASPAHPPTKAWVEDRDLVFYYRRSDILSAVCVRVCYRQQQLAMVYSTTPGLSGKPKCLIQHRTSCSVMCRHDFNEHPCENTVEDRTCPAGLKTSQTRGSSHDCQPCQRDMATPALQSSTICCW